MSWIKRFLARLLQDLIVAGGVAGVGVAALAIAAFLDNGGLRTTLFWVGVVVIVVAFAVAFQRAWPQRILSPADVAGRELTIADLDAIQPRIPRIGIVGTRAVGKTTLKGRFLQIPDPYEYTQRITAHVSGTITDPSIYFAIVDGRGESYGQQLTIAECADVLILILDHNDIDVPAVSQERLASEAFFSRQIREHLREQGHSNVEVHILLNKMDRWVNNPAGEEIEMLRSFFNSELEAWRATYGDQVTGAEHSNESSRDISEFGLALKRHWDNSQRSSTSSVKL